MNNNIFIRNGNQISTPRKYQKNQNTYKSQSNTYLIDENRRLKNELTQKTNEINNYKKKIELIQKQINSYQNTSNYSNNNYYNNRNSNNRNSNYRNNNNNNYNYNNRINYNDYDFTENDFEIPFIGINNLISRFNPYENNYNNRFNPGDYVSDYDYENAQIEQNIIDQLCPNPDNMTYEELLALEDKVGSVSKGLTKNQIKKIPVVNFSKFKFKNFDSKCAVCQYDFNEGEKVTKLTCNHLFHAPCVDEWLLKNKVCPICKKEIKV
jgi:hypothetical protein